MTKVKSLRLDVYSNPSYRKCANGGWTEEHDSLYVACPEGNWEVEETDPALFDLIRGPFGIAYIRPRNGGEGAGPMMGGSYAGTSDIRFRKMCWKLTGYPWHGAVAVHDRYESRELYERLSR